MFVLFPTGVEQPCRGRTVPGANGLIVSVTILAFLLGRSTSWHVGPDQGWTSLLTYGFAHASPWHLLVNMIVLCVIGGPVNRRVGNGWYLATYFGTLLTLGILARWTGLGPVRGASGAIFAVITLFLMLMPAAVVNIVYAAAFPATLVIGLLHAPADWVHWFIRWGHVRVRAWWCVLLIPLMEIVSFFSWRVALGVWPWTHPGHLLGMLCGVVIVLLLPRRISMPQVRV